MQSTVLPTTGDEFSRHAAGHNDRVTSRQANLATVRVTAQEKMKSLFSCFGESLGTVREKDHALVARDSLADLSEIMGFVEMRIVNSAEP